MHHTIRMAGTVLLLFLIGVAHGATYYVSQAHPTAADTNAGAEAQPWKTLGRAAGAVKAGDVVLIDSGVYREQLRIEASGTAEKPIRFGALAGADVVLTGADRVSGWTADREGAGGSDRGTAWVAEWPHSFVDWSPHYTHPDDEEHRLIGRCEQDIGNEDCQVRNCLIEGNEDAGIFDEISFGLHAHDNVIAGNGFAGTPGS